MSLTDGLVVVSQKLLTNHFSGLRRMVQKKSKFPLNGSFVDENAMLIEGSDENVLMNSDLNNHLLQPRNAEYHF